MLIIVAAIVVVAAVAAVLMMNGNGGDDVPSVDESVTGDVKVNDYISYGDDYSFKVTAVNGDKLTVLKGTETIEMTKSEFINSMSAKSILKDMESQIVSNQSMTKVKIGSLKFDEKKTIDGHDFKIYHADYDAESSSNQSGIEMKMDMDGKILFYIDEKGIVQLASTTVTDIDFDLSNVPEEMKAFIEAYVESMKKGMIGQVQNSQLATNLSFVEVIPVSV